MTRDGKRRPEVGQGMEQRGLGLTMDGPEKVGIDQGWKREGLDWPGMDHRGLGLTGMDQRRLGLTRDGSEKTGVPRGLFVTALQ